jgi:hypothetical protein
MALLYSASQIFTLYTLHCAMCFFFPLASLVGTQLSLINMKERGKLGIGKDVYPWLNIFAIAFTFAL